MPNGKSLTVIGYSEDTTIYDSEVYINKVTNLQIKGRDPGEVEEELRNLTKSFAEIYFSKDDATRLEDTVWEAIGDLSQSKANRNELRSTLEALLRKHEEFKRAHGATLTDQTSRLYSFLGKLSVDKKISEPSPDISVEDWIDKGVRLEGVGEYYDAVESYNRAIQINNLEDEIYFTLEDEELLKALDFTRWYATRVVPSGVALGIVAGYAVSGIETAFYFGIAGLATTGFVVAFLRGADDEEVKTARRKLKTARRLAKKR